jgi:hypothetical protein
MYRILAAHGESKERRNQREARSHAVPRLEATAPNQVWTWDISKLATYASGVFLNLRPQRPRSSDSSLSYACPCPCPTLKWPSKQGETGFFLSFRFGFGHWRSCGASVDGVSCAEVPVGLGSSLPVRDVAPGLQLPSAWFVQSTLRVVRHAPIA